MELVLFYYTLLMLLVSILVAAVCLSAYLVSRKKTMLFLSVAFAFYFFDISLVFQDEFIVRSCGDALTSGYLVVRSLASVVTGGGFVTAFWVFALRLPKRNAPHRVRDAAGDFHDCQRCYVGDDP